ncbi:ankyrin repeat-containing protein At5g02620-like [Lolium rigidum]|uniref:ankyrin repeat-containing protein At5g02620-like n=1 Tax=Lolium rigidum TaxID=89674 RepID=UPI001F5C4D66|nr:ankyrin repeat-containing protein At5g02620-like [Lolium rigidum]
MNLHSIQLSSGLGSAAATQPSDDGMMSSKLYLAVLEGRKEEAMALLPQSGAVAAHRVAAIQKVSPERNNVLHLAAGQGHHELIQELYASFGDKSFLSAQNSALDTPLHCAARAGHERAVSLLVQLAWGTGDHEKILGCKNEAGDTALHLAARLGHTAAVEVIVFVAPELASEVNNAGVSPLYLAVMSRSVPAVRAITRCRDASSAGPSSQNALHAAVFEGSEMVRLLLNWNPSLPSEADGSGSTPLHFASSDGDHSLVNAIRRAAPCALRMRDSSGLSALHVAAGMGHARLVEALMEACPDAAELRDKLGRTFLHAAAKGGHSNVMSIAFKKPALRGLLNAQDVDGNTPLHLAVAACSSDVAVTLLCECHSILRADVMNNEGRTPFDLAVRSTSFFSMLSLVVTLAVFEKRSRPQRRDHVEKWSNHHPGKVMEKTSDSLSVVAILIATVAFAAASNVPGSYEQEDNLASVAKRKMVFKGMAVLQDNCLFIFFVLLDTFALMTSVIAVVLLVFGKGSRSAGSWTSFVVALQCLWASLMSMLLAFYAALSAVTFTSRVIEASMYMILYLGCTMLFFGIYSIVPQSSPRILWIVMQRTVLKGRNNRHIRQQYPVASAYALNLLIFIATGFLAIVGFGVVMSLSRFMRDDAMHSGAPAPSPVFL